MLKFKLSQNKLKIIYKLLNDLLLVLVFFLGLALIADGLITGIITQHISFLKIILLIALDLIAIQKIDSLIISSPQPVKKVSKKNKTTLFLMILAFLLIFNSLLKINLWLNFFILALSLLAVYLIYRELTI